MMTSQRSPGEDEEGNVPPPSRGSEGVGGDDTSAAAAAAASGGGGGSSSSQPGGTSGNINWMKSILVGSLVFEQDDNNKGTVENSPVPPVLDTNKPPERALLETNTTSKEGDKDKDEEEGGKEKDEEDEEEEYLPSLEIQMYSSSDDEEEVDDTSLDYGKTCDDKHQPSSSSSSPTQIKRPKPIFPFWTRLTEDHLHAWIRRIVTGLGTWAARNPWTSVGSVVVLSFALAIIGLATNFTLIMDHEELFAPINSLPAKHGRWIKDHGGFPDLADLLMIVHSNGDNVLHKESVRRVFQSLDTLRNVPGYDEVCEQSTYVDPFTREDTCLIFSVTQFWHNDATIFETDVPHMDDAEFIQAISQPTFPNGIPVFHDVLYGNTIWVDVDEWNETEILNTNLDVNNEVADQEEDGASSVVISEKDGLNARFGGGATATTVPNTTTTLSKYLSYAPAFVVRVEFPDVPDTPEFQERALAKLQSLQKEWDEQTEEENPYRMHLEFFCQYAYQLEYGRALRGDMPLVPLIFFVMLGFTMVVYHHYGKRRQPPEGSPLQPHHHGGLWYSRASLGVFSVATIGMALMSGFGILFIVGVPFTNITMMAPFIILGIGLDDTFIISGAYFRRLRQFHAEEDARHAELLLKRREQSGSSIEKVSEPKDLFHGRKYQEDQTMQRVHDTLNEVGLSISLTTITTTFAFCLGCYSSIPAIRWLCIYSSAAIVFDFLYQISFTVALMVLDERRISGTLLKNPLTGEYPSWYRCMSKYCCSCWRFCCCFCSRCCYKCWFGQAAKQGQTPESAKMPDDEISCEEEEEFFMDRFMRWYAKQLLRPPVRVLVIIIFLVFFGLNVWSTTHLEQEFNVEDYVPKDSYCQPFFHALNEYSGIVVPLAVYFRGQDQTDPVIQEQMRDFIVDVSNLPQIGQPAEACWVRDLYMVMSVDDDEMNEIAKKSKLTGSLDDAQVAQLAFLTDTLRGDNNFTFHEKLNLILNIPGLRDIYGKDIVFNEEGEITASRCFIFVRDLDLKSMDESINMLYDQRAVTDQQPINQLQENKDEFPFFTFDFLYYFWELYTIAIEELMFTTIWGVVAVCAVGFLMIPHWTAGLITGPLIVMLYFNLLGTMQVCGVKLNALTYVCVVISIGLLVDFVMHILLRYYETKGATRDEKVKGSLESMGASMMLGGFTTFLGVIPLAFSTTKIFMTIFIAFLSMVLWGLLVGLVFLPVLLSMCGPIVTVHLRSSDTNVTKNPTEEPPVKAVDSATLNEKEGEATPDTTGSSSPHLDREEEEETLPGQAATDLSQDVDDANDNASVTPAALIINSW